MATAGFDGRYRWYEYDLPKALYKGNSPTLCALSTVRSTTSVHGVPCRILLRASFNVNHLVCFPICVRTSGDPLAHELNLDVAMMCRSSPACGGASRGESTVQCTYTTIWCFVLWISFPAIGCWGRSQASLRECREWISASSLSLEHVFSF